MKRRCQYNDSLAEWLQSPLHSKLGFRVVSSLLPQLPLLPEVLGQSYRRVPLHLQRSAIARKDGKNARKGKY